VLGPVPGAIGTLQATEAIKLLTRVGRPLSGRLLLHDALEGQFRTVRLRAARPGCAACNGGDAATSALAKCRGPAGFDYDAFTGSQKMVEERPRVRLLAPEQRVSCAQLRGMLAERGRGVVLVDVRPSELYTVGRLAGSISVPITQVRSCTATVCSLSCVRMGDAATQSGPMRRRLDSALPDRRRDKAVV
jgi:hypothetical protein